MATNLVSTIMQSFTPDVVGKLASTLGLDPSAAQKGIAAGIPGLLATLVNAVSGSDGADRIGAALSHADEAVSRGGDVTQAVHGASRSALETGWAAISSLLGRSSLETLVSVVGQYAGLGQGTTKRLLAFLAPIVLGFLKREQIATGLDNHGFAALLSSQRGAIERAIPQGLAGLMPGLDFSRVETLRETRPSRPSGNRAYWLIPALVIAGVALYFLPIDETERAAQTVNKSTKEAQQSTPSPTPVGASKAVGLQNDILTGLSRLKVALARIKDPASAQASVNEIRDISKSFARLKTIAQELSPEERNAVAAAVSARIPDLNTILDKITNEINLSGEAKPAMDTLKTELANLSKA
jgi:hypothetical protein